MNFDKLITAGVGIVMLVVSTGQCVADPNWTSYQRGPPNLYPPLSSSLRERENNSTHSIQF